MKIAKKIIILIVVFVVTCNSAIFPDVAFAKENINDTERFGDVTGDGIINSSDARSLLRCSVGLEEITDEILLYGDFTLDGNITAEDARTALRVSVGLDNVTCILEGHTVSKYTVKASCTVDGYSVNKCSRCSYKDGTAYDVTEAYGHSFGIWQVKGNVKEKECKTCNYKEVSDKVKTVYLTFDDGPGPYTEKLLSTLRKYGVKATFFVTNQMPKYRYLLPVIVNDGHSIGVHTLTHQWSIYSGRESYLRDFDAMHKIILDDTGVDTKIFRFPGGTNNTVSRSYSRGIMASTAKYMTESGYVYYDWNVDCGDTLGYSSSGIASSVINGIKNKNFSIVLMHDIKYNTVEAMPTIIEYCLSNGYDFAVIDESTPKIQFAAVN